MAKSNEIKELSEILATALADRPDLNKRLSSVLGTRPQAGQPGRKMSSRTIKERKAGIRIMFNKQYQIDQSKRVAV